MRDAGMILDITHMADQAVWESFDLWDGPIMASHCTCRSIVPGQRHLHDDMIRELCRRGGIIGLVFCQFMIDPDIDWSKRPSPKTWVSKTLRIWPVVPPPTSQSEPTWTAASVPR